MKQCSVDYRSVSLCWCASGEYWKPVDRLFVLLIVWESVHGPVNLCSIYVEMYLKRWLVKETFEGVRTESVYGVAVSNVDVEMC